MYFSNLTKLQQAKNLSSSIFCVEKEAVKLCLLCVSACYINKYKGLIALC